MPQVQQVRIPRTYMEQQAYQYQVPQRTYETQTQQIPRTVMVPQTTMETYQYQTQKPSTKPSIAQ